MKRTELKRRTPLKACKGFTAMRTELRRTKLAPSSGKKEAGKAIAMRTPLKRKRAVPATPEQRERWNQMIARGCVACLIGTTNLGLQRVSFLQVRTKVLNAQKLEVHHLLSGTRRMGHDFTVCLCRYHHQTDFMPSPGHPYADNARVFGPGLGQEPSRFREVYGREHLLLEYQNNILRIQNLVIVGIRPSVVPGLEEAARAARTRSCEGASV